MSPHHSHQSAALAIFVHPLSVLQRIIPLRIAPRGRLACVRAGLAPFSILPTWTPIGRERELGSVDK